MPLVIIWRDRSKVNEEQVVAIRDVCETVVALYLDVKRAEVESRVCDHGPFDKNYPPIGIEIDTGSGKDDKRIEPRMELAKKIAAMLLKSVDFPRDWLGPDKSYLWLRICYSAFVPIGFPDEAR